VWWLVLFMVWSLKVACVGGGRVRSCGGTGVEIGVKHLQAPFLLLLEVCARGICEGGFVTGTIKTPAGVPPEPFASISLNGYGGACGKITQTGDLEACGGSDDDHGLEAVVLEVGHAAPPFFGRSWQCSAWDGCDATTPEGLAGQLEGLTRLA
jgi:hypothetical protein